MARGESGRIVLEVDPSHKGELYTALKRDGLTMKDWFLKKTAQYLQERNQGTLFAEDTAEYKTRAGTKDKTKSSTRKRKGKGG